MYPTIIRTTRAIRPITILGTPSFFLELFVYGDTFSFETTSLFYFLASFIISTGIFDVSSNKYSLNSSSILSLSKPKYLA